MLCVEDIYLGRYKVLNVAGQGAFSTVYKAYDPVLERIVAIKLLKAFPGKRHSKIALKEARVLATLSHPNIVKVFDVGESDDQTYLVMEYVDGVSLSDRISQGALSVDEVYAVALKLLNALDAAVAEQLLHGDIKPSNIMIDDAGAPYLLDFGLSRLTHQTDALQTLSESGETKDLLTGTLPYMAPEIILGDRVDHRADMFSLGAVLYEMLTGQRAFSGGNYGILIGEVLHKEPEPIERIRLDAPIWLASVISSMLAKEPSQRPCSIAQIEASITNRKQIMLSVRPSYANPFHSMVGKLKTPSGIWRYSLAGLGLAGFAIAGISLFPMSDVVPNSMRDQMRLGFQLVTNFESDYDVAQGRDVFEGLVSDNPESASARAGLALALVREYTAIETDPATLRRANAFAIDAVEKDPHLAIANIASGWTAEFSGDFETALIKYDMADRLAPDHTLTLEGRARVYKKLNRYDDAVKILERAITLYPENRIFHDELGVILFQEGRFLEAEKAFLQSIKASPDNPRAYANLGQVLHMQGRTRHAIRMIQAGLEIGPTSQLYNNLGTYLFFLGDYTLSADAFLAALELEGNANKYLYWGNLADAYRWSPGKEPEAKAAYLTAIRLLRRDMDARPEDPRLNSRLAQYAAKAGNSEMAKSAVRYATQLPIQEPSIYYRLAVTHEVIGERQFALQMLMRAMDAGYSPTEIANDPEFAALRQSTAYQTLLSQRTQTDG